MVENALVTTLQNLFHRLYVDKGIVIDRAALVPAYEGMVSGLFILTVSMPQDKACTDKIRCLIMGVHEYVPQEFRQSIAGVRVFDSSKEFDAHFLLGKSLEYCQSCEEELNTHNANKKPELIPVHA